MSPVIADLYFQVKQAEQTDHSEIKKIQKISSLQEPEQNQNK